MISEEEALQIEQLLADQPPDEDFEEPWDKLGEVASEPDYQYSGILDRLASGVMGGLPTETRRARGIPIDPSLTGSIAEGVGEAASFYGPLGLPGAYAQGTKIASKIPRLVRSLIGGGEGAAMGALQGTAAQDSTAASRMMGEGILGAAIPGAFSGLGALYSGGMRWLVKPKGPMRYADPSALRPVDPVTETGLNTRLTELMEDHNIPVTPMAVNEGRYLANWLGTKVGQMSTSKPYLQKLETDIDAGFKAWGQELGRKIAPGTNPIPHGATGELILNDFNDMLRTSYREPASKIYDEVTEVMSDIGVPVDGLILALKRHLDDAGAGADIKTGVADIAVGKVRKLINRLENIDIDRRPYPPGSKHPEIAASQRGLMPFNQLWKEAKDLYPTKTSAWTDGDLIQRDAQRIVKQTVRDMASKHESAGKLLEKADVLWKRVETIEELPTVAKILRGPNPQKLVENLTGSARQLRATKELFPPEVVDRLIQRRFLTVLAESRSDKTDEIVVDTFANKLKNIAGTHGNVENEWMSEALKDHPEMAEAINELLSAMRTIDPARETLRPRKEGFGGGAEVISPGAVLRSWEGMIALVTNFATGGQLAKHYTAQRSANPFLGGIMPVQAFDSLPQKLQVALRRAGLASNLGERTGTYVTNTAQRLMGGGMGPESVPLQR
jgi:hypothetical protein